MCATRCRGGTAASRWPRRSPGRVARRAWAISSGGFCRSASRVTTTWPRAAANPADTAGCWPKLRCSRMPTTSGHSTLIASMTSQVESRDPSSTRTSSHVPRSATAARVRRTSSGMFSASLNAGTTTERSREPAPRVSSGTNMGTPPLGTLPVVPRTYPETRSVKARPCHGQPSRPRRAPPAQRPLAPH